RFSSAEDGTSRCRRRRGKRASGGSDLRLLSLMAKRKSEQDSPTSGGVYPRRADRRDQLGGSITQRQSSLGFFIVIFFILRHSDCGAFFVLGTFRNRGGNHASLTIDLPHACVGRLFGWRRYHPCR